MEHLKSAINSGISIAHLGAGEIFKQQKEMKSVPNEFQITLRMNSAICMSNLNCAGSECSRQHSY